MCHLQCACITCLHNACQKPYHLLTMGLSDTGRRLENRQADGHAMTPSDGLPKKPQETVGETLTVGPISREMAPTSLSQPAQFTVFRRFWRPQ